MVDALHEAHRVLRPGGLLIDARPDSRIRAGVEHDRRVVGTVNTSRETATDDRTSDRAIAQVTREGLFRARQTGGYLHRVRFATLAELQEYLDGGMRLVRRARWSVDAAARRRWRADPFALRRPLRYELFVKLETASHSAS